MDTGKRHIRGSFTFKIEHNDNGTFVASIIQKNNKVVYDDTGALYYVVVVILLYGCSILMMIASYIRKNNEDRKLNRYLKEMSSVRKRENQMQLFTAAAKAAGQTRKSICIDESKESVTKWTGASYWSRANTIILEFEQEQRQYRERRASMIHDTNGTIDEMGSNLPSIAEDDMEYQSLNNDSDSINSYSIINDESSRYKLR